MEYAHLGRTRLKVSPLCLGTMNFGPRTEEKESHAIMDKALDEGIQFFDTANVYGAKLGEGITEKIVGRWNAKGDGRRDKVVLATKVYNRMGDGPNDVHLSARHIRQACEESLQRLQTDYIDLYQMHHIDREAPLEEIWQAFDQLRQEGKVLYFGSSNVPGWYIAQTQMFNQARGNLGLISEQCLYNLGERTVELEVLPAAERFGLGVIPWSPLWGGILGGVLKDQQGNRRKNQKAQERIEKIRPQIEKWEQYCDTLGEEPANVALAWLLHQPAVTAPIIGPRTMEQFNGSLRALEIQLDEAALAEIDAIWPATGKAPEAYSW